jgi:hypothetical protein
MIVRVLSGKTDISSTITPSIGNTFGIDKIHTQALLELFGMEATKLPSTAS